jgi:hypothetical protein
MREIIEGAVAGLIATAPMTWTMRAAEDLVPASSRGRLPPRQITEQMLAKAGVKHHLGEDERSAATVAAHYGFGTAAGCLLGLAATSAPAIPRPASGVLVGLAVWAGSYMGWLPAAGIRRSATREPAGRNVQMIAAHVVWGCIAGALLDRLSVDRRSQS